MPDVVAHFDRSLGYIISSVPAWTAVDPVLKIKKKKKKEGLLRDKMA